jgi:hypothetical protein
MFCVVLLRISSKVSQVKHHKSVKLGQLNFFLGNAIWSMTSDEIIFLDVHELSGFSSGLCRNRYFKPDR